eukprot:Lithocolla_globosa_v1_NODE_576_length_3702_cov_18.492185.p2 type:complete len:215 gc:universal NODE_576_length_3702_cov_18.492185:2651-3295(+)
MEGKKGYVFGGLVMVQLVFAGNGILSQAALSGGFDPFVFALARNTIASLILLPVGYFFEGHPFPRPQELIWVTLLGFLGQYVNQIGFLYGIWYTNALYAAMWQPLIPVFTALFGVVLGVENLDLKTFKGRLRLSGMLVAVGGALFLTYLRNNGEQKMVDPFLGTCILFFQVSAFAFYSLLQTHPQIKKFPPHYSNWILLSYWRSFFSFHHHTIP